MLTLFAEHVAPVSDLHLTNRRSPLFLILVRTKSISETGKTIFIRSASMFDFSIAKTQTALWFSVRVSPRTQLGRVEQYQYYLRAQLSKSRLTPLTISWSNLLRQFALFPSPHYNVDFSRSPKSRSVHRSLACFNIREFKQRRRLRLRLRQRHKAKILLVKKGKVHVLHVQHEFPCISLPYSTKQQPEITKF